jgi:hypothetical protein
MDLLITKSTNVLGKDDLLMHSLILFYKNKKNIHNILPILSGKSNISLRIIDWFVTNYAKKNNIMVSVHNKSSIFIYLDYKSQLKAYSKKQFDPFCRRDRISFIYGENGEGIETTVGQLNFFRWAIKTKIIEFIEKNIIDIEKDMNQSVHNSYNNIKKKSPSSIKKRQKRHELSISATRSVSKHDIKINIIFE